MAIFYKLAQPVEFYRKFLEQSVRPDGRELDEFRETLITTGSITSAEGSSFVKLGNTSVICGIKAELATPTVEEPKNGFVVPNVDLPPLCSSQFKSGAPSEGAQIASHFMHEFITSSKCILLEDLCIAEGTLSWVLYADIMCLDYDGNILDACSLALIAALRNVRLPTVTVNPETGLRAVDETRTVSLKLNSVPVSTTFAIFDEKTIFTDPTAEEETLSAGSITVVMLQNEDLCMVNKSGGTSITDEALDTCIALARKRTPTIETQVTGDGAKHVR